MVRLQVKEIVSHLRLLLYQQGKRNQLLSCCLNLQARIRLDGDFDNAHKAG
jgi:hypothetical protein